jgi:hypothetical protein
MKKLVLASLVMAFCLSLLPISTRVAETAQCEFDCTEYLCCEVCNGRVVECFVI